MTLMEPVNFSGMQTHRLGSIFMFRSGVAHSQDTIMVLYKY